MRTLLFTLTICGMAFSAMAQSAAPMVVIDTTDETAVNAASEAEADTPIAFPAAAVTIVGASTIVDPLANIDKPALVFADPDTPHATGASTTNAPAPSPTLPSAATNAPAAPTTNAPATPASPIDKLWPIDTVPIFMTSCVGYQPKLYAPCKCVIGRLMTEMPHDEFLQLSVTDAIERDPRLRAIRLQCVGTPSVKRDE